MSQIQNVFFFFELIVLQRRPPVNPVDHLWKAVKQQIRIMDVQQLREAIMSIWTKISEECFQP